MTTNQKLKALMLEYCLQQKTVARLLSSVHGEFSLATVKSWTCSPDSSGYARMPHIALTLLECRLGIHTS